MAMDPQATKLGSRLLADIWPSTQRDTSVDFLLLLLLFSILLLRRLFEVHLTTSFLA